MSQSDDLAVAQEGARMILNAGTAGPELAKGMGIELEPGEDLIAACARLKDVTREHMENYFLALTEGYSVREAHVIATPKVEGRPPGKLIVMKRPVEQEL